MPDYRKNQDKTLLDIEKLKQQLDEAEIHEVEEGNKIKTIYLGDIRLITPSGKIYYPFAHSNVDSCPRCKGTTGIKNKNYKRKKWTKINAKLIIQFHELTQKYGPYHYWPNNQKQRIDKLRKQEKQWEQYHDCPECGGLGSLEARLDQDFWEQLESELDTIGAWYHGDEGDGCNILVSRPATRGD